MSRHRAIASAAFVILTCIGGGSVATRAAAQASGAETTATPPRPASAEERAAYARLDPLARSVFWSREMEVNPADPVAGVRLAEALRQLGQFEQAAAIGEQVLVTQPRNLEAMLEIGRAQIARGQAFYGIAPLERARTEAPGDWRPLSLLGVAYQQVSRTADAQEAWNAALALSPDNPEVLTNAAMALATNGDAPGAEPLLRRAVAQPAATQKMRLNLAMVLGLQGKTGEAEQIIRRELPPEAAERNLRWLQNQSRPQPGRATDDASPALARTWSSLQAR
ncbi:tetratricopeptide repeat protein [Brevundimonas subvibrioides]|uniref:tetratricopeptide repeat protein n=1 Tax=Brevundimonas subvibrioides TaxID=74313 RepID=UPI0022B492B2|nr:tetratricopeptide repeat protein [Brevundimonas subvibrioides]